MQIDENFVCFSVICFLGHLTRYAIESPACLAWRRLQVELRAIKSKSKINPGQSFLFLFIEVIK